MKAEWGYIIFFYEHKGSQKTIIEDMRVQGQGLSMVSKSSDTVQINGLNFKASISPNTTGCVVIKNDLFGYSFGMGGSMQIRWVKNSNL